MTQKNECIQIKCVWEFVTDVLPRNLPSTTETSLRASTFISTSTLCVSSSFFSGLGGKPASGIVTSSCSTKGMSGSDSDLEGAVEK